MKKKAKKKEMITVLVVEQNALSGNYMESILKSLHAKNDRQDESLTGQVHDQAGHCQLTGCYFEPWRNRNWIRVIFIQFPFLFTIENKF